MARVAEVLTLIKFLLMSIYKIYMEFKWTYN